MVRKPKNEIKKVKHPFEKVILYTCLYKLKHQVSFDLNILQKDFKTFYWFKANPFSVAKPWIKSIFSQKNFLHLQYKCEAYYWVLLLELKQLSHAKMNIETTNVSIKSS